MSWETVDKPVPKQTLSSWLLDNGYRQAVSDSVSAGSCPKALVERLKKERAGARGPGGSLSRAQKQILFGTQPKASTEVNAKPVSKKKRRTVRFKA